MVLPKQKGVNDLFKKLLALCLGISCLFANNQADAWEFDRKAIVEEFNCKAAEAPNYALENVLQSITREDMVYENETVKIETSIGLVFDNVIFSSGFRKACAKSKIFILHIGSSIMGDDLSFLVAPYVQFDITNKTDAPVEFDLNHSMISIGSYQGIGVQQGTKYNGAAPIVQPPVVIPPKTTKKVTLWREDHQLYTATACYGEVLVPDKWLPPFDVIANTNLLGDMGLSINNQFVSFTPKVSIQMRKLKWIKDFSV